jgi:hypothetical protein
MEASSYQEEMSFEKAKTSPDFPFIAYRERAWSPETGLTEHSEVGFWHIDGTSVDATLSHPIVVAEISEGVLEGTNITLKSKEMAVGTNGLAVVSLERRYRFDGDELTYETLMATPETPLTLHLTGSLRRV